MTCRLNWIAVFVLFGAMLAASPALASQTAPADCTFILGFKTLEGLIDAAEGPTTVGECLENQRFDAHGNAEQRTTGGLMVWRKADNWTAFSDGYRTWVNRGEDGLHVQINGATAMMAGPDGTALGTVTLTPRPVRRPDRSGPDRADAWRTRLPHPRVRHLLTELRSRRWTLQPRRYRAWLPG